MTNVISLAEAREAQTILGQLTAFPQLSGPSEAPVLYCVWDFSGRDAFSEFTQRALGESDIPTIPASATKAQMLWLVQRLIESGRSMAVSLRPIGGPEKLKPLLSHAFSKHYRIQQVILLEQFPSLPKETVRRVVAFHKKPTVERTVLFYHDCRAASLCRAEEASGDVLEGLLLPL